MRLFNAFQLVAMFAAAPVGIAWLEKAEFTGSSVAFWVAIVAYIVAFCCMVGSVWDSLERNK
jgi:hypothetical protein